MSRLGREGIRYLAFDFCSNYSRRCVERILVLYKNKTPLDVVQISFCELSLAKITTHCTGSEVASWSMLFAYLSVDRDHVIVRVDFDFGAALALDPFYRAAARSFRYGTEWNLNGSQCRTTKHDGTQSD